MTKKAFLLLLFCIFILCSCSIQDRKDEENVHLTPKEPTLRLKIAVLENMQYPPINNVIYVPTNLKELSDTKDQQLDGLIISKENFEEAAKLEYRDYFKNIDYPVFFLDSGNITVPFFYGDGDPLGVKREYSPGLPYASGFVLAKNKEYKNWDLYLPNDPNARDKNLNLLIRIYNIIQEYKLYKVN